MNDQTSPRLALVMSGGSALGAFHAGAYEVLTERGHFPSLIAGTSIGAVTGALVAGNEGERGIDMIRRLWELAQVPTFLEGPAGRQEAVAGTRLFGRPSLFTPVPPFAARRISLYTLAPLVETLARFADFDRLNSGVVRFIAHATDLITGEPAVFDTAHTKVRPEHVVASCCLPLEFEPMSVDGRLLCDGAMTSNLPVGDVLVPAPTEPVLCFALDAFSGRGPEPQSMDLMTSRLMDLTMSAQSLKDLQLARLTHAAEPSAAPVLVAHVVYDGGAELVGQKIFDFSESAIKARWRAGREAMERTLDGLPPMPASGYAEFSVPPA